MKRLATPSDTFVTVQHPISDEQLKERKHDYELLSPPKFNRKHGIPFFESAKLAVDGSVHEVRVNHCDDPFCKWFGLPQHRFEDAKHKPSRYKLFGQMDRDERQPRMVCNHDPTDSHGIVTKKQSVLYSNWSLAEEIARLARNDKVFDTEPSYQFHRDDCAVPETSPFKNREVFRKKGKHHTSNAQRWQCKHCNKLTNVLPEQRESWTYNQKRNEIVPRFANLLLNKVPVRRTLETLNIGSKTYYQKLELLYKRCLAFLERHERNAFQTKSFSEMWMTTDQMIYHLNNVRKKGQGGKHYDNLEDLQLVTHIIVSAEVSSRYVFRADVAYDWDVTPRQVEADTRKYFDDHLAPYSRKNDRLRFGYAPQPPTAEDTQTEARYQKELHDFNLRRKYVDGMHVKSPYTAMAHYWLIKQMVNAGEWKFISDDDSVLATSLYRVFAEEINRSKAYHFLCLINDAKPRKEAYREHVASREELKAWAEANGYDEMSLFSVARQKLVKELHYHDFFDYESGHPIHAGRPIQHPLATIDKGYYHVDCKTNVSGHEPGELADLLMNVNDKASNEFMQQIRRRLSFLERPLVTARATGGRSYIYANFNPKYAQYAITILRTYYNFCVPWRRKRNITPAQRLGIADRQYSWQDIIYFS